MREAYDAMKNIFEHVKRPFGSYDGNNLNLYSTIVSFKNISTVRTDKNLFAEVNQPFLREALLSNV
jgi:hypothetical protein